MLQSCSVMIHISFSCCKLFGLDPMATILRPEEDFHHVAIVAESNIIGPSLFVLHVIPHSTSTTHISTIIIDNVIVH